MEIERKFLVRSLPARIERFSHTAIEQGYLCTEPVVRVRRDGESYYMTYKGGGMMARREENLPLTREAYEHLCAKADGIVIRKVRYLIALSDLCHWDDASFEPRKLAHEDVGDGQVLELDVFSGDCDGLVLGEIEFSSEEQANSFVMPDVFTEDVTFDGRYHNSYISRFGYKG